MAVSPAFARGALKRLADHQAIERNDWLDAQPGKILHEMRVGELSHFHKIPFYPYYGTADATILYLIVLSETYRWTGDVDLLRQYQQVAENCLKWIDQFGDLDGDGFQEYQTFSSLGYENVGWKDASNASEITATGIAPTIDSESAILQTLGPGRYTTIVRGANNSTGIGLAEVYKLDN